MNSNSGTHNHTLSIAATPVADILATTAPGAFEFRKSRDRPCIAFNCSCGCGYLSQLPLSGPISWELSGTDSQPTLSPSIRQMSGCKWHGHLTAGQWVPCADSGQ